MGIESKRVYYAICDKCGGRFLAENEMNEYLVIKGIAKDLTEKLWLSEWEWVAGKLICDECVKKSR